FVVVFFSMATVNDSGLGSAFRLNGVTPVTSKVTPVTSKKRLRVSSSAKTSSDVSKKRKLSIGQDRSKWRRFEFDVSCDDFLTKDQIRSDGVMIEGSEWYLAVHRRVSEIENESLDDSRTEKQLMVEVTLKCDIPSAAWCAKCKIELEVRTDQNSYKKLFDCTMTSSSNCRGIMLDWRKNFLRGGRITAYLLISRVCNKYVSFPDFCDPYETGIDELIVEDQVLYVNKNLLSQHSRFFADFFTASNGPYRLNGRVDDIVATLQTVYPQKGIIDESNACTIAVIAKEFQFWETLERCEQFLLSTDKFSTLEKIEASLRCNMHSLLSQCSEKLSSMENIVSLMENKPDGFEASEKTKSYLFDLVLLLNKKEKKVEEIIPN
ncbi:hypothetical protein PRIPAC_83517, partial [Pristionchus pacificus]